MPPLRLVLDCRVSFMRELRFRSAQSSPHRGLPQYGQPPEDLANALVQMARASHVPLIAELAGHSPGFSAPKVNLSIPTP